ncbi:MAG: MFS transporter, partial [Microbacterium sp.]
TSFASLGSQIATVAVLAHMWALTHSALWTGTIGLATAIAILVAGPLGGSLADRFDRRNIVRLTTLLQALVAGALTAQSALDAHSPVALLALVALNAAVGAAGAPARRTLPARLLPATRLGAGLALQNLSFQFAMLVGPALGGVLTAWGYPLAFGAQLAAALVSLASLAFLPPLPPRPDMSAPRPVKNSGWRLALRKSTLRGAFASDFAATALAMPIAVFPLINDLYFEGDPRTLGLFLSAIAFGGLGAALLSGRLSRTRRIGRVMFVSATIWGLAIATFGAVTSLWAALLSLAIAGAADTIAVVSRGVLVQLEAPDHARGRISAVEQVIGVAAPEVGNFRGGALAALLGAPASIVIGGVGAALATAIIAGTHPSTRTYEAPTDTRGCDDDADAASSTPSLPTHSRDARGTDKEPLAGSPTCRSRKPGRSGRGLPSDAPSGEHH